MIFNSYIYYFSKLKHFELLNNILEIFLISQPLKVNFKFSFFSNLF